MSKLLALAAGLSGLSFLIGAVISTGLPSLGALVLPLLIILLLVFFNGLFVAAEFALIGVRPTQMEEMANEGNRAARSFLGTLRSSDKQKQYIATAQVGISLASLGLGMYGETQISSFVEPYLARLLGIEIHETIIVTSGYIIAVSLLTYLHIVVGEMIPKSLSLSAPDRTALVIVRFMQLFQFIFAIPVYLLTLTGAGILRIFRIPPAEGHARLHSPEELELIILESVEGGVMNQAEEELIRNIFDFAERQVHQVMTPRPKVEAIPHDIPLPDLLQFVTKSNYSRFPVYEEDLDHIIGIVHIKDLVSQHLRRKGNFDIRLLLRPTHVVPEHYPVEYLLIAFRRRRHHMAIVLDEFGGTAGIVTLEDLVEEVVGEVRDEFDREKEPVVQMEEGELEVAGELLVDDLLEQVYLGEKADLPDVETVGGLIMAELGRVPQSGDQISYQDGQVRITVLSIDGLAVARARIEYPASAATDRPEVSSQGEL